MAGAAVVALACAARLPSLDADLPIEVEWTNAPILDAYWYLASAAGAVEGRDVTPAAAYDLPVHNALALPILAACGLTRTAANLVGAVPGVASAAGAFLATRTVGSLAQATLAGALLAVCYPYAMHNRCPLIYSGLSCALVLGLVLRARGHTAAAWGVGIVATLGYKVLGLALLGGLAAAWAIERVRGLPQRRGELLGLSLRVSGALLLAALLVRAFPGEVALNADRLERYVAADLTAGHVARRVLNVARDTVGALSPVIAVLAAAAVPLAFGDRTLSAPQRAVLATCAGWVGTVAVCAVPLDYRPERYFTVVYPPLCVLAGYAVVRLATYTRVGDAPERAVARGGRDGPVARGGRDGPPGPPDGPPDWHRSVGVALSGGFLSYTALSMLGYALVVAWESPPGPVLVLLTLEVLLAWSVVGALGCLVLLRGSARPPTWIARGAAALGVLAAFGVDGARVAAYHTGRPARSVAECGAALEGLVGPGALLVGPYAPTLAYGTRVAWLHTPWFRIGEPESVDRLRATGATHLAIDSQQAGGDALERWMAACGAPLAPVTSDVVLRAQPVWVYRLSWAEEAGYRLSPYEVAAVSSASVAGWTDAVEAAPSGPALLALARAAVCRPGGARPAPDRPGGPVGPPVDLDVALEASRRAVGAWPSSSRAWLVRAEALAGAGDVEGALEAVGEAWRLEPSAAVMEHMGRVVGALRAPGGGEP